MAIIRTKQKNRFTTVNNQVFADGNLSFQAMGMLTYLLSKPDDWSVSPAHLAKVTNGSAKKTGRDGVYAIIKELRKAGYVGAKKNQDGSCDYFVFDEPINANTAEADEVKKQALIKPDNDTCILNDCSKNEPDPAKPDPDKPDPPKPTLINTDNKQILSSNNKPLNPLSGEKPEIEILDYLNAKRKALFDSLGFQSKTINAIESNLKPIKGRLKNYTVDEIKTVIDHLIVSWGNDASMRQYLTPASIFRASKFDGKNIAAQEWKLNGSAVGFGRTLNKQEALEAKNSEAGKAFLRKLHGGDTYEHE
ncbi:hypothetical protein VCHA34P129_40204 [Vibrio chagasii]|nr:hypothetical protein VCHA34P129_40204 [Vibrio chagasii]CAH7305679.1 hypothetical protein VCHA52P455_40204 [Vibrio chagasii]